ncbi:MAG: polysulfide reductase NrfD, partial [Anaerolineae bacterium]|nr:polysulfide reductase NrfD [Anaerolineae bacterium]
MLKIDPRDRMNLIEPLLQFGTRFWIVAGLLLMLIILGVIAYIQQVQLGLGETGMQRPAYWGIYMTNFVFFIGISLAGTFISAILNLIGADWRRPITRIAESVTVFALVVAAIQIVIDMGRPDRLLFVFLYGRLQSPILWDVLVVTLYLLSSAFYLYLPLIPDAAILRDNLPEHAPVWRHILYRVLALGWRGNVEQWRRLEKAISMMSLVAIPIAVSVHTITSWILATTVQPGWHSTVFGPYFVVTAIFSGISGLFLAMTAIRRVFHLESYITLQHYRNLGLLFITMSIIWGYFTYAESLTLAAGQQTMEFPVLASKLWGQDAPSFWIMLALIGLAFWIMMALHTMPKFIARISLFQPRFTLGFAVIAA